MYYINKSKTIKTFYGIEFKPNEIHQVPGYINDPDFERVAKPVEPPKGNKANKDEIQEEKGTQKK